MLTVSTSLVPSSAYAVLAMMEMDLTVEVSLSEQLAFVTHLIIILLYLYTANKLYDSVFIVVNFYTHRYR